MTRSSNTPCGDHFVGTWPDEYLVRLWGEDSEWGVIWVDVAIYQVHWVTRHPSGWALHGKDAPASAKREYDMPSRSDRGAKMTENPDEAVAICEGFVKSESCTQLRFAHGLHVDGVHEMAVLCHALARAQQLAMELMESTRKQDGVLINAPWDGGDLNFPVI